MLRLAGSIVLLLLAPATLFAQGFEVIRVVTTADGIPGNDVRAVHRDAHGRLWVGTRHAAVGMLEEGEWKHFTTADGLISDGILSVDEDSNGALWFAGGGGAQSLTDDVGWTPYPIKEAMGLDGRAVFSITTAPDGSLWFGTTAGAAKWDGRAWTRLTSKDGLPHPVVHDVEFDNGGGVWFATRRGGLTRIDGDQRASFLEESNARALLRDSAGNLWIGTAASGIVRHDGERFETFHEGSILPMIEDSKGRIWCGSDTSGLWILASGEWQHVTSEQGLPSDAVFDVHEDEDGTFWLGTQQGLVHARFE